MKRKDEEMVRRIIAQCSQTDFKNLEHLSELLARDEEVYLDNLSKTQRAAIWVLKESQRKGLPFKLLRVLREVLIWGEGVKIIGFEFKFFRDPKLKDDIAKFKEIMLSR